VELDEDSLMALISCDRELSEDPEWELRVEDPEVSHQGLADSEPTELEERDAEDDSHQGLEDSDRLDSERF